MLSRTDWLILPTIRRTFATLSQCQAVDIDPKKERNFTRDLFSETPLCERRISRLLPSVDSLNELRVHWARRKIQATKKHELSQDFKHFDPFTQSTNKCKTIERHFIFWLQISLLLAMSMW
jgi:hypothetical protein